jgi:subtilisin family serine protease
MPEPVSPSPSNPSTPPPPTPEKGPLDQSDARKPGFTPETLDQTVIAIPLLHLLDKEDKDRQQHPNLAPTSYHVIIDLNLEYPGGREAARQRIKDLLTQALASTGRDPRLALINELKESELYVFATLDGDVIRRLVRLDDPRTSASIPRAGSALGPRAIYRIWPDFEVRSLITHSVSTVKADAARSSFAALGNDIVWAVLDSGIDSTHPHFHRWENLKLEPPIQHRDFTVDMPEQEQSLVDRFGHGTHVAGIIGGEMTAPAAAPPGSDNRIRAVTRHRNEKGEITYDVVALGSIAGMAPRCKLVSMKVLDEQGRGRASNLIAALEEIQRINGYGRRIKIHGVNLSVGYDFEPQWFACGQSPLCVEVDRLVRSGVVVVVAAGNTGYGYTETEARGTVAAGLNLSINDPGNAELAITVGATHRDMPHVYGVSYFSSKGPTGDGRLKPDLVAPGEKILSCGAGMRRAAAVKDVGECDYVEESGTSMAAPHVSGVIAAFLSIRKEFIGRPEAVKEIFLSTATDLKRDRYFQGRGLVDLMRAIQSV